MPANPNYKALGCERLFLNLYQIYKLFFKPQNKTAIYIYSKQYNQITIIAF